MRYLRFATIIILVVSVLFSLWANNRYYSNLNTDLPVLSNSLETLEISVKDPPEAVLAGLQAQDATDGDLTDQIMVASVSHFLETGTVNMKYVVFDSHNNSATLTRKVHYTDYTAPQFSLEKAPVYMVGRSFDLLDYIRVEDCIDGDISDNVRVISNMVNNFAAGNYPVVLEVSNAYGDTAQVTVWVRFLNKESSAVVELKKHIVYVQQGDSFQPKKLLKGVTDLNGTALDKSDVQIQGSVNMDKPGCYQLIYSYDVGKLTAEAPLTVVVTERQD